MIKRGTEQRNVKVNVYTCSDGSSFDNEKEARKHERGVLSKQCYDLFAKDKQAKTIAERLSWFPLLHNDRKEQDSLSDRCADLLEYSGTPEYFTRRYLLRSLTGDSVRKDDKWIDVAFRHELYATKEELSKILGFSTSRGFEVLDLLSDNWQTSLRVKIEVL